MPKLYYSVLTSYGSQAFARAMASRQPLNITTFAVGDGNGRAVQPDSQRTSLVREVYRANVSAISLDPRNPRQVIFELTIPENIGGFWIREMGIFDNQNRLVAYANCPDSFKPQLESGSGKVQVLRMILLVSSSDAVTLTVDDSVIFAKRGELTPQTITATSQNIADENGHTHAIDHASTSRKGVVQLTNDTGLDSESLALTAKAGKRLAQEIAQNRINTTNLANQKVDKSAISDSVSSTSQTTVASSRAVKTAYDKGVEGLNKANEVDRNALKNRGFQRLNGNLLITPDSWTDNSWNEWASLRLATKRGYWQFEVNPHSDNANDRRFNMVYREGGDNFYLHFRSIGTGEFVAYESWVIQQIANIPHASTTRRGIAQLTNDTGLDSESLAFSAKGAKILAQQIAQNRINISNLTNQKLDKTAVSDSVSSTSQTTVASSRAVKTAYDKGVEGLNKANEAKTAADNAQRSANNAQTSANNANNNANGRVSKSGDVMTGQLHIKIPNSDYGAVHLFNRANRKLVIEANPDSEADSIGNFIYREANDSNPQATVKIPKKSGILAVREEVERAYNRGTEALNRANQAHFPDQAYVRTTVHDNGYAGLDIVRSGNAGSWASRIEALPDKRWKFWTQGSHEIFLPVKSGTVMLEEDFAAKARSLVNRRDYNRSVSWKNNAVRMTGQVIAYPDGRIEQIFHIRAFRAFWLELEPASTGGMSGSQQYKMPVQLWTAMPSKITKVHSQTIRAVDGGSITYYAEAGEWNTGWQLFGNMNERSWVHLNLARVKGGEDEPMDLYLVVEGY